MSDIQTKTESAVQYAAPALEKGFNVIELLAQSPLGLTIKDIAAGLGYSMSEIFRVIIVMERRGWLYKNPDTDRYSVTPKVLDLAFRATPAQELAFVAAPVMRDLAYQCDQSCHLVVRNGARGMVILRQENPGPTGFMVRLGADIDLANSCSGHVLLAFADPAQILQILTQYVVPEGLDARLEQVRRQGYEMMASWRTRGVTDMSYPIYGFDGRIAAAVTIPFLEVIDGSPHIDSATARQALAAAAHTISAALGFQDTAQQAPVISAASKRKPSRP